MDKALVRKSQLEMGSAGSGIVTVRAMGRRWCGIHFTFCLKEESYERCTARSPAVRSGPGYSGRLPHSTSQSPLSDGFLSSTYYPVSDGHARGAHPDGVEPGGGQEQSRIVSQPSS